MTIVERLRASANHHAELGMSDLIVKAREAAVEIEWLRAEVERLKAAYRWQNICLAYQGDTQPCATPCRHCSRISAALENKPYES
jgi:hypothetical protein